MKSRHKLSKNYGIHDKNCEISGPYTFWTSVKQSNIPDVEIWNFWTLFGLEIEEGGTMLPWPPSGYAPEYWWVTSDKFFVH